jgi:D-alanine transaminase
MCWLDKFLPMKVLRRPSCFAMVFSPRLGPPKSEHVLEGIRVELLRELCEECDIAYNLRPLSEADVLSAEEVLLSSATKEILPVTRIDGDVVGHGALRGKPGPVYARLYEAYQGAKRMQLT